MSAPTGGPEPGRPVRPPVVLLAGGLGTRLAEETGRVPKPMVEIGGRPVLWHIMKGFGRYGFTEFHIALGYKGEAVKRYFLEYRRLSGDLTVDLGRGTVAVDSRPQDPEPWRVHLVDTGQDTNTGGRLRRLASFLAGRQFVLTYGDGLADVDLDALLRAHAAHRASGYGATVTAVRSPSRFGTLTLCGDKVEEFAEKRRDEGWINGGFMVLEPVVFDYLEDDSTVLEHALEQMAKDGRLAAYRHPGFWQCMDTLNDRRLLEALWQNGRAPWRTWEETA